MSEFIDRSSDFLVWRHSVRQMLAKPSNDEAVLLHRKRLRC